MVTFSVMVYYTKDFKKFTPHPEDTIKKIIGLTNEGYLDSDMPVRVKIFCTKAIEISEEGKSHNEVFDEFFKYFDKSVRRILNTADSSILLTEKVGSGAAYCGFCYFNPQFDDVPKNIGYVNKRYALTEFTFGHELGHMFGAGHNIEEEKNVFYPYGHGWHYPGQNERSILAYPPGKRKNLYSMDKIKGNLKYHIS